MDKTKNWSMDLRDIFSFWGRRRLGLRWRRRGDQLALVQSIVLVKAKRKKNQGMEPICMDTCLGLCMDLLVRKPS